MAAPRTLTVSIRATPGSLERVQETLTEARNNLISLENSVTDLREAISDIQFVIDSTSDTPENNDTPAK